MPEIKPHVILISHTHEPEKTVALAAKLCYSKATLADLEEMIERKDQAKFIKNLAEVGHESVLEHASFTVGIEGISRACSHQLVRHRIASYSQQSQRYCDFKAESEFDYVIPTPIKDFEKDEDESVGFDEAMYDAIKWYKSMRSWGIKPEDARFLLPNASATRIIVTMNARSWRHFFNLRCCSRAQWEIRHIAQEIYKLLKEVAPNIFSGCGPTCVVEGKCPEGKRSCGKIEEMQEKYSTELIERGTDDPQKLTPNHPPDPEMIDHPRHYNAHPSGVECVDLNEHLPGNWCAALKYVWRCEEKGKMLEDLKKALWYLKRELKRLKGMPNSIPFLYTGNKVLYKRYLDKLKAYAKKVKEETRSVIPISFLVKFASVALARKDSVYIDLCEIKDELIRIINQIESALNSG